MASSCELLDAELALDRVEAELARELPPHLRAFAAAYAAGRVAPAAPAVLARPTTLETARRALAHPLLAERALALLRLAVPIALHVPGGDVSRDTEGRSADAGAAYREMLLARDAIAQRLFGIAAIDLVHRLQGSACGGGIAHAEQPLGSASGSVRAPELAHPVPRSAAGRALELAHRLHGSAAADTMGAPPTELAQPAAGDTIVVGDLPPTPPGWREPDGHSLDPHAAWRALAAPYGVAAAVTFAASAQRARTFVVGPRECIVVVPARVDSPAARFVVMHELGHVLAACLSPPGIPRALDEAVAAFAAISGEPVAIAARARRLALARQLDAMERGAAPAPAEPPWSLWNDPGAQAAYVAAEHLADELAAAPDLGAAVAEHRDRIDRATVL